MITRQQLVDVVMKYLTNYPAQRSQPAFIAATAALLDAFDCDHPQTKEAK